MNGLALTLWLFLSQTPATTCVSPATSPPGSESTCCIVHCYADGRCECPLFLPDGRRNRPSARECEELSKKLPLYRTSAPPVPEKVPKNVDLVTPERRKHILDGDGKGGGGHRPGTGIPGKTEFPKGWSDEKIIHEISDVATDPKSGRKREGDRTRVEGTREGILIRVIVDQTGQVITGYPLNTPKNP